MIFAVYAFVLLALGVGVMIAVRAQAEYESDSPELGEVPERDAIKRHRATGWRYW